MSLTRKRTARASIIYNDLFWEILDKDDGVVRWVGYNDVNWWSLVAQHPDAPALQRTGKKTGRVYRLDPHSDTVTITAPGETP